MNFLGPHKANIQNRIPITFTYVRKGSIIEAKYKGLERLSPKLSMYLVLQPNYRGYMHVLDLTFVHPQYLKTAKLSKLLAEGVEDTYQGKKYNRLQFNDKSRDIYYATIKTNFPEGYRTLKRIKTANQGFYNIKLINYKL